MGQLRTHGLTLPARCTFPPLAHLLPLLPDAGSAPVSGAAGPVDNRVERWLRDEWPKDEIIES